MRAKAKYYVEWRRRRHGIGWQEYEGVTEKRRALRICRWQATNWFYSFPEWRVRHKGRTLARWQNGKRVTT